MSIDEISVFLKYKNRKEWELFRWQLFQVKAANKGLKDGETPEEFLPFSWDNTATKEVRKLSKEEIQIKTKQAEAWLDKRK
jgi:hypothetical protein